MPVRLEGSCHCGAVRFTAQSNTPVPYQLCVCSTCRKVGGVSGSILLSARTNTFQVLQGEEDVGIYEAVIDRDTAYQCTAISQRNFCLKCSAMMWLYDKMWPDLIYPFASAIDTPELEAPQELVVVQASSKPAYVRLPEGAKVVYEGYDTEADDEFDDADGPYAHHTWHKKHGKAVE
ncbi:Mss4-like protein [Hygrophoropsis aurantiaca]|uniref:Mss4-like protein n=1 Tax=Hygrophoropsis aurantiaca TaxID=72124 RepID=A0ACB8A7Z0_9AGAM|nr:Mss4-like protein [Hygrophoropsis aurantiaca]